MIIMFRFNIMRFTSNFNPPLRSCIMSFSRSKSTSTSKHHNAEDYACFQATTQYLQQRYPPATKIERNDLRKLTRIYRSVLKREDVTEPQAIFEATPTNAVYIIGIGSAYNVTYEQCASLLTDFSFVHLVYESQFPFVIAVFSVPQEATKCHDALYNTTQLGKQIYVEYCKLNTSTTYQNFLSPSNRLPHSLPNADSLKQLYPIHCLSREVFDKLSSLPFSETLSHEIYKRPASDFVLPGLLLVDDFISTDEEDILLETSEKFDWDRIKLRSVKHFGHVFNYLTNQVNFEKPSASFSNPAALITSPLLSNADEVSQAEILHRYSLYPTSFNFLLNRMQKIPQLPHIARFSPLQPNMRTVNDPLLSSGIYIPDQLTVNKYDAGQGIPPHVDVHSGFDNLLAILSIQSSIVMDFTLTDKELVNSSLPERNQSAPTVISIVLPPRSLLILSSFARLSPTHSISPRQTDKINSIVTRRSQRISYTFRVVLKDEFRRCDCPYTNVCDTALGYSKKESRMEKYERLKRSSEEGGSDTASSS